MVGSGNPGGQVYFERANLAWTLRDERWFLVPAERVAPFVAAAVTKVFGRDAVREEAPRRWRAQVERAASVFNRRDVVVTLRPADDPAASVVSVHITFEPSTTRVGALLWLTTSVVGLPAMFAWRAGSVARARSFARTTFDALFAELDFDRVARDAYR